MTYELDAISALINEDYLLDTVWSHVKSSCVPTCSNELRYWMTIKVPAFRSRTGKDCVAALNSKGFAIRCIASASWSSAYAPTKF
jgi:hypothetical protein